MEERDDVRDLLDRLMSVQASIGGAVVGDTWATTLNIEDEDAAMSLALQLVTGVVGAVEMLLAASDVEHPARDAGLTGAALRLGVEVGRAVESLMLPDIAKIATNMSADELVEGARAVWNHGPSGSNSRALAFLLGMDVDAAMDACTEVVDELKRGRKEEWSESALHRGVCMGIHAERRRWQS